MNPTKIIAGGGTGGGAGLALVHFAGHLGMSLTPEDGAWLALATGAVGMFLVHNGVRGAALILWRGTLAAVKKTDPPAA